MLYIVPLRLSEITYNNTAIPKYVGSTAPGEYRQMKENAKMFHLLSENNQHVKG